MSISRLTNPISDSDSNTLTNSVTNQYVIKQHSQENVVNESQDKVVNEFQENVINVSHDINANLDLTKLKFVCMNVKGINDKFSIPGHLDSLIQCDVILLCETWLQKHTKLKKYRIPGFEQFNNNRKHLHKNARRASGGMIVYIRNALLKYVNVVKTVCDHFMVLEIQGLTAKPTYIFFSYITPKDTTYLCKSCDGNYFDTLTDLVVTYSNKGHIGVCGDLNGRTGNLSDEPIELQFDLLDGANSDLEGHFRG